MPHSSWHTALDNRFMSLVTSCMLFLLTLAHSTLTLFLLFAALALVILSYTARSSKTPSQAPENNRVLPQDPSSFPRGSAPSIFNQPPVNILDNTASPLVAKDLQMEAVGVKQPYDAFLVLDVEATCFRGSSFEWPNEIIEWPVCVLRWKDKSLKGRASRLEIVDEFRSFIKPTWKPQLSQFCTDLTGITQTQVDYAPTFPKVLKMFARFLAQHGLIDPKNGRPLQRFCWCSDGPFDVRDFVVKQCFISNVPMPSWLRGDVLDVRKVVSVWAAMDRVSDAQQINTKFPPSYHFRSLNITQQLRALGLGPFQGRVHCGIDDTRNIARIVIELARREIRLEPNTSINSNRRWQWMGRPGEVLEYCLNSS